jgi:hypothetical protein
LTGTPAVEPRQADANGHHTVVFTFPHNITAGSATVAAGNAMIAGTPTTSGNTLTVKLSGVANAQEITVALNGVTDAIGQTAPASTVKMRLLLGDVNGSGTVTASDIALAKSQSGSPLGEANFRADVNVSGTLTASDISLVKAASGTSVP